MTRQFVSYPKSGRSWIRFMLDQLEVEGAVAFHHDQFEFNDGTCPPHDFDLSGRLNRYSPQDRIVYLERDPRDVMVSLYHQVTGRFRDFFHYDGTISDFIRHDYFGAETLLRFRTMWAEISRQRGYLRISYEDCHADSAQTLDRIVDYLGFQITSEQIAQAASSASFERMKCIEEGDSFPGAWLRLRNGAPKVRVGKVGGYRNELDSADIQYLELVFRCGL